MGVWQPRERRTCRIEERMGAHENKRTPPPLSGPSLLPSPMLRHINPLTAEPLQTEAQVRTPAASHENADTSITPQGGKKKKTCWTWWGGACHVKRKHLFIYSVYSAKQTGVGIMLLLW